MYGYIKDYISSGEKSVPIYQNQGTTLSNMRTTSIFQNIHVTE